MKKKKKKKKRRRIDLAIFQIASCFTYFHFYQKPSRLFEAVFSPKDLICLWDSLPDLFFYRRRNTSLFKKFVHHVLSARNNFPVFMEFHAVLEAQASPFDKLKTLTVKCYDNSFNIPDNVVNYFVNGSSFGARHKN